METEQQIKTIGTHSGVFHADEVLACTMLTQFTNEYKNAKITRTRDQSVLDQQDLVVDVGGIYDHEKQRYDHHQRSFTNTLDEQHKVKLSGAGLIYKHFGQEVIAQVIRKVLAETKISIEINGEDPEIQKLLYDRVYTSFIESVDGGDNGVNQYSTTEQPNYSQETTYGHRVSRLNPGWIEVGKDENQQFELAMKIAEEELVGHVKSSLLNWYPGRPFVKQSLESRMSVHSSGQIIKLEKSLPWKDHLYTLEKELDIVNQIKFVLFPEQGNRAWRIQAINVKGSFDLRLGLKKEWRGIKDMDQLKSVSKIDDIVFVHNSGFIGGAVSYDSALSMAVQSIEAESK